LPKLAVACRNALDRSARLACQAPVLALLDFSCADDLAAWLEPEAYAG
jgi:hypothetical protein